MPIYIISQPQAHHSQSYSVMLRGPPCYGVGPFYGVSLCYVVNLCYGVSQCYGVGLCYGVMMRVAQESDTRVGAHPCPLDIIY